VNGLQNHTDSETDKTVSDNDDGTRGGGTGRGTGGGKVSAQRGTKAAAADKNNGNDNSSSDDDDDDDDVTPVMEPRPAKVIAGEVIKQWQTKTRSKGSSVTVIFRL